MGHRRDDVHIHVPRNHPGGGDLLSRAARTAVQGILVELAEFAARNGVLHRGDLLPHPRPPIPGPGQPLFHHGTRGHVPWRRLPHPPHSRASETGSAEEPSGSRFPIGSRRGSGKRRSATNRHYPQYRADDSQSYHRSRGGGADRPIDRTRLGLQCREELSSGH